MVKNAVKTINYLKLKKIIYILTYIFTLITRYACMQCMYAHAVYISKLKICLRFIVQLPYCLSKQRTMYILCNTVRHNYRIPSLVFADHTGSTIGYYTILSSVRQSLCLQRGVLRRLESVWGLKLYHHVSNKELPIHFFKHLSCTVYRLATKHSHRQTS